jgi:hypothetical protein
MRPSARFLFVAALAAPIAAQATDQKQLELKKREAAAARDADALFEVAEWCKQQGLVAEAQRICQNVIKLKPAHEGANRALGNELVDGVWLTAKDAESARKRIRDAEFKAKGLVEVGGVWVEKDHVEDARRGIFHFGSALVTKDEYRALSSGMVRHPVTGEPIAAAELERAGRRFFPIGTEGRWVDEKEANQHHAEAARPWILRSDSLVLVSTLPIATLETLRSDAERTLARLRPILGFGVPKPGDRPTILVAATQDEFRDYGNRLGDESSAFGAFLAREGAVVKVPLQGDLRPAVGLWDNSWGPYNLPHAVGLAYAHSLASGAGVDLPAWFLQAVASMGSRFEGPESSAWFAQRLVKAGGLKDLNDWFKSFGINGDMEFESIDATITQAGLLLNFCVAGRDKEATAALAAVTAAFAEGKGGAIEKAVKSLATSLQSRREALGDYLQKLAK